MEGAVAVAGPDVEGAVATAFAFVAVAVSLACCWLTRFAAYEPMLVVALTGTDVFETRVEDEDWGDEEEGEGEGGEGGGWWVCFIGETSLILLLLKP